MRVADLSGRTCNVFLMKMYALPPETNCRNKGWQSPKVIPGLVDCRGVSMAVALIEISPKQLKAGMKAGGHPRSYRGTLTAGVVSMAVALSEISPNQLKAGMRAGGHPRSFRGSSTAGMVSMAVDSCETTSALLLIKTWYKASLRSFNFNV